MKAIVRLWHIKGLDVMRGRQQIATITQGKTTVKHRSHCSNLRKCACPCAVTWQWRSAILGMERIGFADYADILEDVKYYYRYRRRAHLVLTFQSGRKLTL